MDPLRRCDDFQGPQRTAKVPAQTTTAPRNTRTTSPARQSTPSRRQSTERSVTSNTTSTTALKKKPPQQAEPEQRRRHSHQRREQQKEKVECVREESPLSPTTSHGTRVAGMENGRKTGKVVPTVATDERKGKSKGKPFVPFSVPRTPEKTKETLTVGNDDVLSVLTEDVMGDKSSNNDGSSSSLGNMIGNVFTTATRLLGGGAGEDEHEDKDAIGNGKSISDLPPEHTSSHLRAAYLESALAQDQDEQLKGGNSIDFLEDPSHEMTWSRRIALHLSRKHKWYNPSLEENGEQSDEGSFPLIPDPTTRPLSLEDATDAYPFYQSRREIPSIEKAWAYFEHVAMPRYIVPESDSLSKDSVKKGLVPRLLEKLMKGNVQLDRAERGENKLPTKLYHPLWTPHSQLGDFGLGMGLYFSTLRAIAILTFLAGVLNMTNLVYFSSEEYSDRQTSVDTIMRGSAICTRTEWVLCESSCTSEFFQSDRIAEGVDMNGNTATFALKNDCDGATIQNSMFNLATLVFVAVGILVLNQYLENMEVEFDEDEQTAQDYSILINNPPHDATDPEEWRKFFYDNFDGAQVTTCTVAVDNDILVRTLVERREKLRQIEMMVEPGTYLDTLTLAHQASMEERQRRFLGKMLALVSPGIPELFARVVVLNAKVQGLAQHDYPATRIFVTFETEADQRRVLAALSVGSLDVTWNKKSAVAPNHLFRGERVLSVEEPDEPNTVRWQDLNERLRDRLQQQATTTVATFAAVVSIAFVVWLSHESHGVAISAMAIAVFNSVFPEFAKLLTNTEAHSSESGKQRSLYFKIALFRWVNTAIVITVITPFTSTLQAEGGLIAQIYALFFAEIVTTSVVQLVDPMGHIQRHVLAPRAKTQDEMNVAMQGQVVELAERYTNMTKILFLALWYCAVFPTALFLCSFALFINYFVDRFSLMRTWKRAPNLGTKISEFSRRYFFSLAIVAMALVSSYYWSAFPFDDLCVDETSIAGSPYAGTFLLDNGDNATLALGDRSYRYCKQDFLRYDKGERSFPFISRNQISGSEWMTHEQEISTEIYGWTAVFVVVVVGLSFLWTAYQALMKLFRTSYDPCGNDQEINFSDVPSISSYVPEVTSPAFSYPLLACDTEGFDTDLLEWTDPDRPHSYYDLTRDAQVLLHGLDVSRKVVFSQVVHWPPQHTIQEARSQESIKNSSERHQQSRQLDLV